MSEQNPFDSGDAWQAPPPPQYPPHPPQSYPPPAYPPQYPPPPYPPAAPYATRYTPAAPPAPRSRGPLWIVLGCVLLVVAGVVVMAVQNRKSAIVRQVETAEQRRAAALSAFGEGTPVNTADPAQVEGIRALFTNFTRAARQKNGIAMVDCFDVERLCDEVVATRMPGSSQLADRKNQKNFVPGMRASMSGNSDNFAWEGFEIRQVKPLPRNDEALVYLRVGLGEGYTGKFRFWVRRSGGAWKIFDYEDLSFGVRCTSLVGVMISSTASGSSAHANRILGVIQAVQNAGQQMNEEEYEAALKTLDAVESQASQTPPQIEALRQTMIASAKISLSEPEAAMKSLEKSASLHADQPVIDLLKAAAYNALLEPEKSLEAVKRYEDAVGLEALSCYHAGSAYVLLDRNDEAAAAFRKGLVDTPTSAECFHGLCQVLGAKGLPELRKWMAVFPDKSLPLRMAGNSSILEGDDTTLQLVIGLFPDDSDPFKAYFQGELHMMREEPDKAIVIFERNAARLKAEPLLADVFHDEYTRALNDAGRALDAYRLAADKPAALVSGADVLVARQDAEQLQKLLDQHVVQRPGEESIVNHYRGLLADIRKQPAEAERLLRRALAAQPDSDWKEAHRRELVRVMFDAGRYADAYKTLSPKWDVFEQMSSLATWAENAAALGELVALARVDFPAHAKLNWHQSTVAWLEKDYKACADLLMKHRESLLKDKSIEWFVNHRLTLSLIRLGRPADAIAHIQWVGKAGREVDDYHEALAYAAAGNVPEATRRLSKILKESEMTLAEYLEEGEEDLAKALAAPAFAQWKAQQLKAGPAASAATRPATRPVVAPTPAKVK